MWIKQRDKLFDLQTPDSLKFVYVEGKGLGIFTDKDFIEGEEIISFGNTLVSKEQASSESVQVEENTFLDTEWLTPEAFINHSCSPNTKLDFRRNESRSAYVAIKDIRKDEEVTFNYLTTEWDMSKTGFRCECGSPNCYGQIKGFKHLTQKQQEQLRPFLLPYLIKKIA